MKHRIYAGKKVGIWGFGKTGQSVLAFIAPHAEKVMVLEASLLTSEQKAFLKKHNALLVPYSCLEQFLEINDIIIPSPGVDLRPHAQWAEKWVGELDIFTDHVTTKTVAITGSAGKTSTVTILTELFNRCGIQAISGGNIGVPLLDLVKDQEKYNVIILELSSFQLELSHSFAPSIATVTNLFPNHLDRHGDLTEYARAKGQIFMHQQENDWAIIPFSFLEAFILYTGRQKTLWLADDAYEEYLSPELGLVTFLQNWRLIFAILECFSIEPETVLKQCTDLQIPQHRFEKVGTYNGVTYYNDSKATIAESLLESINQLQQHPIILFLGGLSKGVDRTPTINQLPRNIKHVLCFGKEADTIMSLCKTAGFAASSHRTLEEAWQTCIHLTHAGYVVLFSPAGASYDLFKNYEERGNAFKKLVHSLSITH